jgi:hypothetical protein
MQSARGLAELKCALHSSSVPLGATPSPSDPGPPPKDGTSQAHQELHRLPSDLLDERTEGAPSSLHLGRHLFHESNHLQLKGHEYGVHLADDLI